MSKWCSAFRFIDFNASARISFRKLKLKLRNLFNWPRILEDTLYYLNAQATNIWAGNFFLTFLLRGIFAWSSYHLSAFFLNCSVTFICLISDGKTPATFFSALTSETRPSQIDKKQKSFWVVVDSNAWVTKPNKKIDSAFLLKNRWFIKIASSISFIWNKNNDIKETWRFDGFMSSLSRDEKLTWFVVIFIEKESAKRACKLKCENGQIIIKWKFSHGWSLLECLA